MVRGLQVARQSVLEQIFEPNGIDASQSVPGPLSVLRRNLGVLDDLTHRRLLVSLLCASIGLVLVTASLDSGLTETFTVGWRDY